MALNTFLLSIFAKNLRIGTDIQSMRLRYLTLTNIYINLSVAFAVIIFDIMMWAAVSLESYFQATLYFCPGILISLMFLRQGRLNISCIISSLCMIFANFIASGFGEEPMIGIYGLLTVSMINFFLAYSARAFTVTIAFAVVLFVYYAQKVRQIFAITLNDEQSKQITTILIVGSVDLAVILAAFTFQKFVEFSLWQVAHVNYEKSETLTKEVIQASHAKDVFVSSLSHEIRNPLNSLKGSIDYLLSVVTTPDHPSILRNAKLSCEIIVNLANNVLDAAKLRADKMDVSYSRTSFTNIIRKAFVINSEGFRVNNIQIKACIDKNLPKLLWIDPARLLQIMMNLLSNALKFTPANGKITVKIFWCSADIEKEKLLQLEDNDQHGHEYRHNNNNHENLLINRGESVGQDGLQVSRGNSTVEFNKEELKKRTRNIHSIIPSMNKFMEDINNVVHPSSDQEPWTITTTNFSYNRGTNTAKGFLKVQVSDTGCGIAQEHIPRLFQMFTQAHQSVNQMHGGTGLGLWICKQLCQKMGGDIKLYSVLKKGTSFVFYISVDNEQISAPSESNYIRAQHTVRVMIVDDFAHNRELHRLLVEQEGAQTVLASSGEEAVAKFKSHEQGYYDCIMMDVLMPGIDGFAAARMIRAWEQQQQRTRKVDICFVSGEYYDEDEVMTAFKLGEGTTDTAGFKCIKKPIDVEALKEVIQSYNEAPENVSS